MENSGKLRKQEGKKYEFLLEFLATRVPESGWDKLVVSLVSTETGKVVSRTSRGLVCNGTCKWTDTLVESVVLKQNYSDKLYKLIVQMGSLRVGILGETYINLMDFISAETPQRIALPLQNCNADTTLHVKIQCLTPRGALRAASLNQEEFGSIPVEDDSNFNKSQARSTQSSIFQAKSAPLYLSNAQLQTKIRNSNSPASSFRTSLTSSEFSDFSKEEHHHKSNSFDRSDSSDRVCLNVVAPSLTTIMPPNGSSRSSNSPASLRRVMQDGTYRDPSRFDRNDLNNGVGFAPSLAANMLQSGSTGSFSSFASDEPYHDADDLSNRVSLTVNVGTTPSTKNTLRNGSRRTSNSPANFQRAFINPENSVVMKVEPFHDSNSNRNDSSNGVVLNVGASPSATDYMPHNSSRSLHWKHRSGSSECCYWEGEHTNFGAENEARIMAQKLEVAETTIHELRGEASSWERQARRLGVEMENLKQQLVTEQKNGMELKVEMSALEAECSSLRAKFEQLKTCKLASPKWGSDSRWEEDGRRLVKALQEEVTYEKEVSEDLRVQLRKTQDLNLELLCAVAELEETLHNREGLTKTNQASEKELQKLYFNNMENRLCNGCKPSKDALVEDSLETLDVLRRKLMKQETDLHKAKEENDELLQKLNNATKELDAKEELISVLEARLEGTPGNGAPKFSEEKQILVDKLELHAKDPEDNDDPASQKPRKAFYSYGLELNRDVMSLVQLNKLQVDIDEKYLQIPEETNPTYKEFEAMIHSLQKQKEELELQVCNLSQECVSKIETTRKSEINFLEASQKLQIHMTAEKQLQQEIDECHVEIQRLAQEVADKASNEIKSEKELNEAENKWRSLDVKIQELLEEKKLNKSEIEEFETRLQRLVEEINQLTAIKNEYFSLASRLEQEKVDMQERLEDAQEEVRVAHERLDELVGQIAALTRTLDSQLIAKRSVDSRALGLERVKEELETQIVDLEETNVQLSQRINDLETQLCGMAKERESHRNLEEERNLQQKQTLEQELHQKRAEIVSLQLSLDDLREVVTDFKAKQLLLEHDLQVSSEECRSVTARCANLEVQIMEAKADIEKRELTFIAELQIKNKLEQQLKIVRENEIREAQKLSEVTQLQNQVNLLQYKLAKQQEEKSEFERRVISLEEKKVDLETKLKSLEEENTEFETRVKSLEEDLVQKAIELTTTKNLLKTEEAFWTGKRSDSAIHISTPSRDSMDIFDLQEQLRILEEDCKEKEEQLADAEQAFIEREADLICKLEALELSNEQLAKDLATDQLRNELIRLQNQNSLLSRREQDLLSQMRVQEVLQAEIERLEEANYLLEARLTKLIESVENPSLLEEIVNLETELAEAVEANNIYKLQLKRIFEREQNVNMGAPGEFGDLEQVIDDLYQYKKKATELEMELHSIHERYSMISLQLAEAEVERGELLITVKNLKAINQRNGEQ